MLFYKTAEEIDLIRKSCQLVSETHAMLKQFIVPGVNTLKLDRLAFDFIKNHNAEPAFLNYNGFPNSLYISVNETIVHGIPSKIELRKGDIVSIDCGVIKDKYFGNSCYTFAVGEIDEKVCTFIDTAKQALNVGMEKAREGKRIGDVGNAISLFVSTTDFSLVRQLGGNGIGKQLHEKPNIQNTGRTKTGIKLKQGMVFTINPIINYGSRQCKLLDDGWTLKTKDGNLSAHFKHTVAINGNNLEKLSNFEIIEKQ